MGGRKIVKKKDGSKAVMENGRFTDNLPSSKAIAPHSGPIAQPHASGKPTAGATRGDTTMNVYEVFKERTTVGEPDWHQDRDDLVLNNPHPAFDGFINISPTGEGTYEACAYEFQDPDGEEIIEVDAEIFKTQKEAKEWAETWRP